MYSLRIDIIYIKASYGSVALTILLYMELGTASGGIAIRSRINVRPSIFHTTRMAPQHSVVSTDQI